MVTEECNMSPFDGGGDNSLPYLEYPDSVLDIEIKKWPRNMTLSWKCKTNAAYKSYKKEKSENLHSLKLISYGRMLRTCNLDIIVAPLFVLDTYLWPFLLLFAIVYRTLVSTSDHFQTVRSL